MIHGERDLIPPDAVRAVFERAGEPKKLVIYDCLHTDLYVREPWVTQSADEAIAWFNRYLHNPRAQIGGQAGCRPQRADHPRFLRRRPTPGISTFTTPCSRRISSATPARPASNCADPPPSKRRTRCTWHPSPTSTSTVDMVVAENDLVMVYGTLTGTNTGEFMGNPGDRQTSRVDGDSYLPLQRRG